jgi:hypothetical protein
MSVRRTTTVPSNANCPLVACQSRFESVLSIGGAPYLLEIKKASKRIADKNLELTKLTNRVMEAEGELAEQMAKGREGSEEDLPEAAGDAILELLANKSKEDEDKSSKLYQRLEAANKALPAAVTKAEDEAKDRENDPNYPTYMCEGEFPAKIPVKDRPFADSKQCVFLKQEFQMRGMFSPKQVSYTCAKCTNWYTVPKIKARFFEDKNNVVLPDWKPGN